DQRAGFDPAPAPRSKYPLLEVALEQRLELRCWRCLPATKVCRLALACWSSRSPHARPTGGRSGPIPDPRRPRLVETLSPHFRSPPLAPVKTAYLNGGLCALRPDDVPERPLRLPGARFFPRFAFR